MKTKLFVIVSMTMVIIAFQNCSPVHDSGGQIGELSNLDVVHSLSAFESTLYPILQKECSRCHGVSQQPMFAVVDSLASHDLLLSMGLANLASPASSRIVAKIQGGHQGFPQSLASEIQTAIEDWVTLLKSTSKDPSSVIPPPPVLEATFTSIHVLILLPKCATCHSPGGERPQENYSDYDSTIRTGKITPGNIQDSAMFQECRSGSMPENSPPLSNKELAVLEEWIRSGAPNN